MAEAKGVKLIAGTFPDKYIYTDSAENGKKGFQKFLDSPISWFDAILMDIRITLMDDGKPAKKIRILGKSDAQSFFDVALSTDAFEESILTAKEARMSSFFPEIDYF